MSDYPKEINHFQAILESLKGIENVCSGINNLAHIEGAALTAVDFSHLPIATLLRTNGGMENEAMIQFEFTIDKTTESLISLEFISWFVRDLARAGKIIQMRPFALPPQTALGVQLGDTLKFHIDYFMIEASDSLQPILDKVSELSKSLSFSIDIYEIPTKS